MAAKTTPSTTASTATTTTNTGVVDVLTRKIKLLTKKEAKLLKYQFCLGVTDATPDTTTTTTPTTINATDNIPLNPDQLEALAQLPKVSAALKECQEVLPLIVAALTEKEAECTVLQSQVDKAREETAHAQAAQRSAQSSLNAFVSLLHTLQVTLPATDSYTLSTLPGPAVEGLLALKATILPPSSSPVHSISEEEYTHAVLDAWKHLSEPDSTTSAAQSDSVNWTALPLALETIRHPPAPPAFILPASSEMKAEEGGEVVNGVESVFDALESYDAEADSVPVQFGSYHHHQDGSVSFLPPNDVVPSSLHPQLSAGAEGGDVLMMLPPHPDYHPHHPHPHLHHHYSQVIPPPISFFNPSEVMHGMAESAPPALTSIEPFPAVGGSFSSPEAIAVHHYTPPAQDTPASMMEFVASSTSALTLVGGDDDHTNMNEISILPSGSDEKMRTQEGEAKTNKPPKKRKWLSKKDYIKMKSNSASGGNADGTVMMSVESSDKSFRKSSNRGPIQGMTSAGPIPSSTWVKVGNNNGGGTRGRGPRAAATTSLASKPPRSPVRVSASSS